MTLKVLNSNRLMGPTFAEMDDDQGTPGLESTPAWAPIFLS